MAGGRTLELLARRPGRVYDRPQGVQMTDQTRKVMSWPMILGIMLATGLVLGLVIGTICTVLGVSGSIATTGTGVSIGVVGALLLRRRNEALAGTKK